MQSSLAGGSLRVHDVRASRRRSFAGRVSHRVASGLSFAGSAAEVRTGTVTGTTINTLCSVIGAGVLSLPLALYLSSILVGLAILAVLSSFAAFSVYCLTVGCDATRRYSLTEVVAFVLYPPQSWEDFLYKQGAAKDAARLEAAAAAAPSLAAVEPASDTATVPSPALQPPPPLLKEHGVGLSAESASQGRSDSRRVLHSRTANDDDNDDGRLFPGPALGSGGAAQDVLASSMAPRTSGYAELRDTYAREEWRRRRLRRLITVLMEFVVFCNNYGTLVIYSKVIADSMPPVVSYLTHTEGVFVSKNFWFFSAGVVFFALSCARNMEELKWSSLLGFLTIFYIVVLILYRFHTQRVHDYPHVSPRDYGEVHWFHLSPGVLQTVSTFGLAFSYHFNVPYFYKELEDRRPYRMMQSLSIAFPIIIACYAFTGVFGYLTFGDAVAAPRVGGNIVSNYPESDLLMNIGRLGLFAHFACVFPVVSICTRRGLHRLLLVLLTWTEQSALMREAAKASGARLTEAERDAEDEGATPSVAVAATATAGDHEPRETSPLLHSHGTPTPGYEVFASSGSPPPHPQHGHSGLLPPPPPPRGGGAGTESLFSVSANSTAAAGWLGSSYSSMSGAEPVGAAHHPESALATTVDVDRDVGSPEETTTLAIVLEAGLLVSTTVLIAATVSGIDFVIHLIGTLFSVFIVMVAPGFVGWCVFSPTGPFGSASAAVGGLDGGDGQLAGDAVGVVSSRFRLIRLKRILCIVNAVLGVVVTCIGIAVLVYDTLKKKSPPSP
ncbi:amino acid transporter [Novymonas esmeraldas]|uniref:Amino acid transporter n=1 Tax=Novymonas esmeraldas TaxID=1808958 RepID=A0AAW0F513_9TRYP